MRTLALVFIASAALVAASGGVPSTSRPEDVGMSAERLQRIHEAVVRHVDAKDVAGAVALVARRGKIVHFEAQGFSDIDGRKPMMKDSIFRLASMSKPITAVAVMMMIEEGKIRLTDRVSTLHPRVQEHESRRREGDDGQAGADAGVRHAAGRRRRRRSSISSRRRARSPSAIC